MVIVTIDFEDGGKMMVPPPTLVWGALPQITPTTSTNIVANMAAFLHVKSYRYISVWATKICYNWTFFDKLGKSEEFWRMNTIFPSASLKVQSINLLHHCIKNLITLLNACHWHRVFVMYPYTGYLRHRSTWVFEVN